MGARPCANSARSGSYIGKGFTFSAPSTAEGAPENREFPAFCSLIFAF